MQALKKEEEEKVSWISSEFPYIPYHDVDKKKPQFIYEMNQKKID